MTPMRAAGKNVQVKQFFLHTTDFNLLRRLLFSMHLGRKWGYTRNFYTLSAISGCVLLTGTVCFIITQLRCFDKRKRTLCQTLLMCLIKNIKLHLKKWGDEVSIVSIKCASGQNYVGNAKMHADLAIFSNRVLQHRARTYRRVRQAGRPLQQ